ELEAVAEAARGEGVPAVVCSHFAEGSKGAEELAREVVRLTEADAARFAPLYPDDMPLFDKIERIATELYGASAVRADKAIHEQLRRYEEAGYGGFPVCMAKTQYSFSTDPTLKGAPSGHTLDIREVRLSAG